VERSVPAFPLSLTTDCTYARCTPLPAYITAHRAVVSEQSERKRSHQSLTMVGSYSRHMAPVVLLQSCFFWTSRQNESTGSCNLRMSHHNT